MPGSSSITAAVPSTELVVDAACTGLYGAAPTVGRRARDDQGSLTSEGESATDTQQRLSHRRTFGARRGAEVASPQRAVAFAAELMGAVTAVQSSADGDDSWTQIGRGGRPLAPCRTLASRFDASVLADGVAGRQRRTSARHQGGGRRAAASALARGMALAGDLAGGMSVGLPTDTERRPRRLQWPGLQQRSTALLPGAETSLSLADIVAPAPAPTDADSTALRLLLTPPADPAVAPLRDYTLIAQSRVTPAPAPAPSRRPNPTNAPDSRPKCS